jgi:shikimate dehydrogenase
MESVRGVVVTMPHKQAVVPLLDVPSERVRQIGACNIVRFDHSRRATGEIMDGLALVRALGAAGVRLAGERVYLSGAGGAGSAIAHALVASGVAALTVHNRTHARAEALVQQLKAQAGDVHVQTGDVDARGHALVIDATSTGIDDAADPFSFDPATIEAGAAIADITIGARPTPLMTHAGARGHRFIGGEQMLRAQIEAFVDFMLGQDRTV